MRAMSVNGVATSGCAAKLRGLIKPNGILRDLLFLLLKIAVIVAVFALMFTFLFGIMRYPEPSMDPSVKDRDLVIFYRYTKAGYAQGDVIALKYNGQGQTRRVVARAGDTVDITDDGLIVNGAVQQEPGIAGETVRYDSGIIFPLTVPEGQVFVLADNRAGATDSRIYGPVRVKDTNGKVMALIRIRNI